MTRLHYIEIDGKRYRWREVLQLRREQKKAVAPGQQPALFKLKDDHRPAAGSHRRRPLSRAVALRSIDAAERQQFLRAAENASGVVGTFCATLAHTGCRLSEALALTACRVDVSAGILVFESLKKRRKGIYRAVPVPPDFIERLKTVHDLAALGGARLWPWSRTTGWRRVREIMDASAIRGLCATPKGVRHGFGIKAVTSDVPLNMAQKWLGHARLATTAIYTDAVGPEEQKIAERMWAA